MSCFLYNAYVNQIKKSKKLSFIKTRLKFILYFKFCLLDYDKVELREKLIRDHQLETVRKQSQNEDKSAFKKYTDGGQLNLRYLDGNMPKNKDVNNFIS